MNPVVKIFGEGRMDALDQLEALMPRIWEERDATRMTMERLRTLFADSPNGLISADMDGIITAVNHSAEKLFGWAEPELVGRPIAMLMPERYREPHRRGIQHLRDTGEGPILGKEIGVQALHRDGHEFPIVMVISAYQTGVGRWVAAAIRPASDATPTA